MAFEGSYHRKLPEDKGAGSTKRPVLSPCCPSQVSTSLRETWPFSRRDAQSPRRLQGRKCLSSFCPWHSPGMDRPRTWTYCVFLVPTLTSVSSSHVGGHRMKDFLTLPMCLAPGQTDTIATCVSFTSLRDSDLHCARGVTRWLTHGKNYHVFMFLHHRCYFPVIPTKRRCFCPPAGCASGPHRLVQK